MREAVDDLKMPAFLDLSNPRTFAAHRARLAARSAEGLKSVMHSDGQRLKITGLTPLSSAAGRLAQEAADFVRRSPGMTSQEIAEELSWHPAGASGNLSLAFRHGLVCRLEGDMTWWHVEHLAAATWEMMSEAKKRR